MKDMLGIPAPPCADRGCTDSCSNGGERHTNTIFNVVRQNRLHPREKSILLESDRERITTHMEEEDHFTQTLFSLLLHCCTRQQSCCPWQPLTFSLGLSHSALSFSVCSTLLLSIYRQKWCCFTCSFVNNGGHQLQLTFNSGGCQ